MGIVPVLEHTLARLYEIHHGAIGHADGHLVEGMRAALSIDQQQYDQMRNGLLQTRQGLLRESANNLRQILRGVNVKHIEETVQAPFSS